MAHRECRLPQFTLGVLPPPGSNEVAVLLAAARSGELPLIDAVRPANLEGLADRLDVLHAVAGDRFGLRLDACSLPRVLPLLVGRGPIEMILLAGAIEDVAALVAEVRSRARRIYREVIDQAETDAALAAGVDGLVARGNECGGRVGTETSFVLLQRLLPHAAVPVWAQGGISPCTLAACLLAGAAGAILDSQLALAEESDLPDTLRSLLAVMDGSETICLGEAFGPGYRVHRLRGVQTLRALEQVDCQTGDPLAFHQALEEALSGQSSESRSPEPLWPIGQDAALAARLAARHRDVAGILRAYRRQAIDNLKLAVAAPPLGETGPLARALGTRYPIVQGPMTRVSDVAPFADAVAQAGALPFLALALLRGADAQRLLEQTAQLLRDRPWGVGILAFIPPELRAEQLRAVLDVKPRFAILAGGRPDQAQSLEAAGITTYLHCPSPRLLERFLRDGARRFVFEGRECGGHVGPLSSFLLWDAVLDVLVRFRQENTAPLDLLFAGGIHDGLSAAMLSALVAHLACRDSGNVRVGVLMGTAYLFTHEAVSTGAIVPTFQELALGCRDTTLLDAQGGHAIRVIPTAYASEFNDLRRTILREGVPAHDARGRLEEVNIGRLRIASKGIERTVPLQSGPLEERGRESHLAPVSIDRQQREGMYMIGSVGALETRLRTIAELHQDVCQGSVERLASLAQPHQTPLVDTPIAVVGISAIFPDAPDLPTYWVRILQGHNAIREVPSERWPAEVFYDANPAVPDRVVSKWGGFIAPVPFDPVRYGIPPASLSSIEPMQLLVLEVAQRTFEHAGYVDRPFPRDRTAIIIGAGGGACDLGLQYQTRAMVEHYLTRLPDLDPAVRQQALGGLQRILPTLTEDSFPGTLCNVAAGRVANRFDLSGPNFAVDAACASSLAALDVSLMELRQRTSDMVLVGGGDAQMNISSFLMFSKTHALSPRGRCRPFDAQADGIAISEGLAGVILKRLDDAVRDGDHVYAVIRNAGSASDGRDKSLTAPSLGGQKKTLERAYAGLDFTPASVGLVEAHGTGTVVGDRTELQALREVFEAAGATAQSCALGSVKSQIGHTKNGAGLAGLIKSILALHHRTLPPTLFEEAGPAVRDRAIPFYLSNRARPWFHSSREPRRAAVSAFGFGGTNFHVVLEEFPGHTAALSHRPAELFLFRGATRGELAGRLETLEKLLGNSPGVRLIDLAALSHREAARARGECRLAVLGTDVADLRSRLLTASQTLRGAGSFSSTGPIVFHEGEPAGGQLAFLFPGQGSQYLNMLEDLALYFPVVREVFEAADRLLQGILPGPLTQTIFPPPAYALPEEEQQRRTLDQTWFAQPALGAANHALATFLGHLGIEPDHVAGHSYGEYVALCTAGVLSFSDLVRLSETRGRLVQQTQGQGAVGLVAVQASLEKLAPILDQAPGVAVAARNAPDQTVLGGTCPAIDHLVPLLEKARLPHQRLAVSAGFHIPEARPAAQQFAQVLGEMSLRAPRRQVWSNRTAARYPTDTAAMRLLLEEHLTEPVRFRDQIEAMYEAGCRTFLEVGPGQVLTGLVRQTLGERPGVAILATNRRGPGGGLLALLEAVGKLFALGYPVRSEKLFSGCDLKPLEIADLGKGEPALPRTTWMLDGGTARPLEERPVKVASKAVPAPKPAPSRMTPPPAVVASPPSLPSPPALPAPVMPMGQSPAAVEVMNAFQVSMRQFLDYQARAQEQRQALMQNFLQTQANIVGAFLGGAPLPGLPSIAMPSMPPPPTIPMPAAHAPATNGTTPAPVAEAPSSPPVEASPTSGAEELMALPSKERGERLQGLLLELVSDRTGYPIEMLELDHNMEADLGIDSIKRTEIFGGLRDRLGFQGEAYEKEEYYIKLGKLRTLREVLGWLNEEVPGKQADEHLPGPGQPEVIAAHKNGVAHDGVAIHEAMRFVIEAVPAPLLDDSRRPAREREVVLVTDGPSGRARKLFALLRGLDYDLAFVRHAPAGRLISAGNYEVDLLSPEGISQLRGWIEEHHGKVTALCHLLPLDPGPLVDEAHCLEVRSLFHLASAFSLDLLKSRGTVLGVTGMGGSFGVETGPSRFRPGEAAVPGFVKSLAREWQEVHVKALDFDPAIGDAQLLGQIVAEFQTTDRKVEVGYEPAGRVVLDVIHRPVERSPEPMIELDSASVILITGGARGITAAIAGALARRHRPTLVLVGRSPLPEAESPETRGVTSPGDLKRLLADRRRRRGELVTPTVVESEYRSLVSGREIQMSLDRLKAAGCRYEYHSLDVRDDEAFAGLIRSVYREHGRIDGVLHAAGLLGDSLLVGKSAENFDRAFDTKVRSALTLIRTLQPESLRFLVFFSSVAARFGNVGQTDYAAANEVLNKLASKLDRDWPARVVSIGWGPWDEVGMARPEKMSPEYLGAIGFAHMPVDEGCEQFLDEIAYGHKGEPEVLIFRPSGKGPKETTYTEAQFYLRAGKR